MIIVISLINFWVLPDLYSHASVTQLWGRPRSIVSRAVAVTGARRDHHDGPPCSLPISTLELHQRGFGSVRGAAASVCAGATEQRFVGLDAGAVLIGEVNGFAAPHHLLAPTASLQGAVDTTTQLMCATSLWKITPFLCFVVVKLAHAVKLRKLKKRKKPLLRLYLLCKLCQLDLLLIAGSNHTQPTLLHHLTPAVLICDPGGHPHAARLRARSPLCSLLNAVQAPVPSVKTHSFFLTVGWMKHRKAV